MPAVKWKGGARKRACAPEFFFRSRSGRHDTGLDAVAHEAGDVVHVELFHRVGAVLLDRAHAEVELAGDLLGGEAFADEAHDFELARRERRSSGKRRCGRRRRRRRKKK